ALAVIFGVSKEIFVSMPAWRILTRLFSTSIESTSTEPSLSPAFRMGRRVVAVFPGSCSVISRRARGAGPRLVIPVRITLPSGTTAGGGVVIGGGGGD